jgi:hypothetical protein
MLGPGSLGKPDIMLLSADVRELAKDSNVAGANAVCPNKPGIDKEFGAEAWRFMYPKYARFGSLNERNWLISSWVYASLWISGDPTSGSCG